MKNSFELHKGDVSLSEGIVVLEELKESDSVLLDDDLYLSQKCVQFSLARKLPK